MGAKELDCLLKNIEVIIMAGGKSEGFVESVGMSMAKYMIPVKGVPLIDYLIRIFKDVIKVGKITTATRKYKINEGLSDYIKMHFPTVEVLQFERGAAEIYELKEISKMDNSKDWFLVVDGNTLYQLELLNEILSIFYSDYCKYNGDIGAITYFTKINTKPKIYKNIWESEFEKLRIKNAEEGYFVTSIIFKKDSIKSLEKEIKKFENGNDLYIYSRINLIRMLEENEERILPYNLKYVVAHLDKKSHLPYLEEIASDILEKIPKQPDIFSF